MTGRRIQVMLVRFEKIKHQKQELEIAKYV